MRREKPKNPRGVMKPFTLEQVAMIATFLMQDGTKRALRDLAMLETGVSTLLRSCDLVQLTLDDVTFDGEIVTEISVVQQKTGTRVDCNLSAKARTAIASHIVASKIVDRRARIFPLCTRQYQRIVKDWCIMLRVNPKHYCTHSIRRTLSTAVYRETHNLEACRQLLGHFNLRHTGRYLGVDKVDAFDLARKVNG